MPQTFMDWATIISAACAVVGIPYIYMRIRKNARKTNNKIINGSGNTQTGGLGDTKNSIKDGNDNEQRG